MFGLGYVQLIAAAALAAAAASSSWWLTKDHYEGVIAKAKIEAQKDIDAANLKADNAAVDWQAWAEVQPAKIVYRNRAVAAAFKAEPAWAAASIPASVRVLLDQPAPGADAAAGSADRSLSPAGAASAGDQSGSGTSLSGLSRFFGRMLQAPQRAGAGSDPQRNEVTP